MRGSGRADCPDGFGWQQLPQTKNDYQRFKMCPWNLISQLFSSLLSHSRSRFCCCVILINSLAHIIAESEDRRKMLYGISSNEATKIWIISSVLMIQDFFRQSSLQGHFECSWKSIKISILINLKSKQTFQWMSFLSSQFASIVKNGARPEL